VAARFGFTARYIESRIDKMGLFKQDSEIDEEEPSRTDGGEIGFRNVGRRRLKNLSQLDGFHKVVGRGGFYPCAWHLQGYAGWNRTTSAEKIAEWRGTEGQTPWRRRRAWIPARPLITPVQTRPNVSASHSTS